MAISRLLPHHRKCLVRLRLRLRALASRLHIGARAIPSQDVAPAKGRQPALPPPLGFRQSELASMTPWHGGVRYPQAPPSLVSLVRVRRISDEGFGALVLPVCEGFSEWSEGTARRGRLAPGIEDGSWPSC